MDEKIQKLKANINKEVVSKFDLAKLKEFQFLPINVKNTTLFAVGNQHTRKHEAGELIKAVCGCDTQFIFLPNEAFDELFDHWIPLGFGSVGFDYIYIIPFSF